MDKALPEAQQMMMMMMMMMMPFERSLLSDRTVLKLSELGELLLLAFPRSEPSPHLKMLRPPKLEPLATPSY